MDSPIMTSLHNRKVAIIGAGFVGSSIAYALTIRNLATEIILIDVNTTRARGEAMDIQHGIPYMGISSVRAGDYPDCRNCDLIIITAGRPRKPGESRLDMIADNIGIMKNVVDQIKPYYSNSVIMVVSNPVDIMAHMIDKWMGLPNGMVFGTGCILDTSRLIRRIADYTNLNTEAIKCNIVGEHGDTQFPVWSRLAIAGLTMEEYCQNVGLTWNEEIRERLHDEVRRMGASIIEAKGRTHYGIATCVCSLADAVLNQRPTIAPVCSPLQGEYGISGVTISLPSIVGIRGVEHRLQENWTRQEVSMLRHSANALSEKLAALE